MHAMLSLDSNFDVNLDSTLENEVIPMSGISADAQRLKIINRKDRMPCNQVHVRQFDESALVNLAEHQMHAKGAHKCCQCAYDSGYRQGSLLQRFISLDIDSLGDAPTSIDGHYKSVHQAFALGYSEGVNSFIKS